MEAFGAAASAISLAALFTNCIRCFQCFKSAQNCPTEFERLLVKLDCEKARLLIWSETVGILRASDEGRFPQLDDLQQDELVRRCLHQIIALLTDGEKLQSEYGSRPASEHDSSAGLHVGLFSRNSMELFKTRKRRFFARFKVLPGQLNWLAKTKWAICDKVKFEGLLLHLKDFVDDLIQIVPIPPAKIDETVEEDIASIMNIQKLRLAVAACEESYPKWSTKASDVIRESEIGSLDRRNYEEIIREHEDVDITAPLEQSNQTHETEPIKTLEQCERLVILNSTCADSTSAHRFLVSGLNCGYWGMSKFRRELTLWYRPTCHMQFR